jgi:hypothetical protein
MRGVSRTMAISESTNSARVRPLSSATDPPNTSPPPAVQMPAQILRRWPAALASPDQSMATMRSSAGASAREGDAEADAEPFACASRTLFVEGDRLVIKLLLFCILLVLCWPLALIALLLYPVIWLVSLPLRLIGVTIAGVFALITAIFLFPVRVLRVV